MKKVLFVSYGREKDIKTNISKINNIDLSLFNIKIATVVPYDDKIIKTYNLLKSQDFTPDYEFNDLFYYFFQDRFINEMSELEGYVSIDNSIEDIWSNFYRTINFINSIIKDFKPDFIYSGAPDNFFACLFIKIANKKNIKTFWLEQSYFQENSHTFFSDMSYSNDIVKGKINIDENEKKDIEVFFKKDIVKSNPMLFKKSHLKEKVLDNIKYIKQIKKYKNLPKQDLMLIPFISLPFLNLKNKIIRFRNSLRHKIFLNEMLNLENLKQIKKTKKILLLALHYQPEAATLSMQPLLNNQYYLIKILSDVLPPEYILCVKDHPIQNKGLRPYSFYKKIVEKKNCYLLENEISSNYLLENNLVDRVVAIGGTIGFEEILRRRPPLIFSNVYYSNFKYIFKANLKSIDTFISLVIEFLNFDYEKVKDDYEKELKIFLMRYYSSIIKNMPLSHAIQEVVMKNYEYWRKNEDYTRFK